MRNFGVWEAIEATSKTGTFVDVAEHMKAGGKVWTFSDIHFGHKNIIHYSGRPFSNVEEMNVTIAETYKQMIGPNDIVIWCGDIGFMSENAINEILRTLPGYKIHIYGNHDIHRDGKLYKLDFDEHHACVAYNFDDVSLAFTHYPMDTVIPQCINVHGHIHTYEANWHNINVCVEKTKYVPRNLLDVLADARQRLEQNG